MDYSINNNSCTHPEKIVRNKCLLARCEANYKLSTMKNVTIKSENNSKIKLMQSGCFSTGADELHCTGCHTQTRCTEPLDDTPHYTLNDLLNQSACCIHRLHSRECTSYDQWRNATCSLSTSQFSLSSAGAEPQKPVTSIKNVVREAATRSGTSLSLLGTQVAASGNQFDSPTLSELRISIPTTDVPFTMSNPVSRLCTTTDNRLRTDNHCLHSKLVESVVGNGRDTDDSALRVLRKYKNQDQYLEDSRKRHVGRIEISQLHLPATEAPQQTIEINEINEIKEYTLKYINVLLDKQYTDWNEFYNYSFLSKMGDQGIEFIVAFVLIMSFSKKHKDKYIVEVMREELGAYNVDHHHTYKRILVLIRKERKYLLSDRCKESIHDYYDEYIDNIKNSTKYLENKRGWKTGGDDDGELPILSRGAYMYNSKNKIIRDIVERKMSYLKEKIGSVLENYKMTAICNYIMEQTNHIILYSDLRERLKCFSKDHWFPDAEEEKKIISTYIQYRYGEITGMELGFQYKLVCFLKSFGNCDHFARNAIQNITVLALDEKYAFGLFVLHSTADLINGHSCCYLHDTVTNKIMIIDAWENIYYDIKFCEHFISKYLEDHFTVSIRPTWNTPYINKPNFLGSEINIDTEYNVEFFLKHVKLHYQSIHKENKTDATPDKKNK